jgi:hypothetical protein
MSKKYYTTDGVNFIRLLTPDEVVVQLIETEAAMDALLLDGANEGKVYKYVGASIEDGYQQNQFYIIV